jgi:transcriptional regulator with XRE-family HTH domain
MDLHIVRESCKQTLARRGISQYKFAKKYRLSHSWLNKFLRAKDPNPRTKSVTKLQSAIDAEWRG